jgi:PIN domain nuclease of toxin-antitoxin system
VKLLLDTCAFLWIVKADRAIPARVAAAFASADNDVFLSAASIWEIVIKHGRGRLFLPAPPGAIVERARERHGLQILPIDEDSAVHVGKLPALHADPFDRMLVSQAIVHGMTILTPDPLITQYPARTAW